MQDLEKRKFKLRMVLYSEAGHSGGLPRDFGGSDLGGLSF